MIDNRLVLGFELHLPVCSRVYGQAPCQAAIGVTGDYKCFNTPATCQDPQNYQESDEPKVLRWVKSAEYVVPDVGVIPSLQSVRVTPMELRPGIDIGSRESATITFSNHSDNDFYLDPYYLDRDYDPYFNGDFWSKFDERYPNTQGYQCYVVRGHAGQTWDQMEKSSYIVDRGILSESLENFTFTVRDIFMFLQNNKTQIPRPCDGFLASNIGTDLTPFDLEPPGIGDFTYPDGKRMYPSSGFAYIGEEYFQYSISGDTVTPIARGLRGTEAVEHEEGDSMQVVEVFNSVTSSEILQRIFSYTPINPRWYNVSQWDAEVEEYDNRLYSGEISEPTNIDKILNELSQDLCLSVYPDVVDEKIILEYVRNRVPVYHFNDGNMFDIKRSKDYDKRTSAVYIRFGRRNPLLKMDENINYLGRLYRLNDNQNEVLQKNSDVVHSQYSRFIPLNLREAADVSARVRLGRYSSPPRIMNFSVDQSEAPKIGKICGIQSRFLNDARGIYGNEVPMQIVKLAKAEGRYHVTAEEYKVNLIIPPTDHVINVIVNQFNVNLRILHDSLYSSINEGDVVRLVIDPNIWIGAQTWGSALNIGDWPEGVTIIIDATANNVRIQGRGGYGGVLGGGPGSPALTTSYPITVLGNPKIWSGGGGGGGNVYQGQQIQGGGGAGFLPGDGSGMAATPDIGGGHGGVVASGGNPGLPGNNAVHPGGPPGNSVSGFSLITFTGTPDFRGPIVG